MLVGTFGLYVESTKEPWKADEQGSVLVPAGPSYTEL